MEIILGIDLGTTNSVVSLIEDGAAHVISEDGTALLPSVVGVDEEGQLLVGHAAHNQFVLAPERTVRSVKRRMGTDATVRLGKEQYSPQEISAIILRKLKTRAEKHCGRALTKAVITVPAFFKEIQREATREAGELAGLEVVRIINEPTAASLSYDPHPTQRERLLVYDLGGGTFDVSAVQIEQGVVEVLASHGDTQLGGDDFDQLLLDHVCDQFAKQHEIDLRQSLRARSRLLNAVEEAKKTLSDEAYVTVAEEFIAEKDGLPLHLNVEVSRVEYEELIEPLLEKTLTCLDKSLTDAKLQANQIDKVVLVGGASRTPLVHQLLQERLGQPVHTEVNPDLCVAMGAAVQGALIAGLDVGPVLVDITPHTLGIQALGWLYGFHSVNCFSTIIERNTPLPVTRSEVYHTTVDGQKGARIAVFQGEDPDARHNEQVGEFVLEGLADVKQGNDILVRFSLDLDGILSVTATEHATGLEQQLVIDNAVERFRQCDRLDAKARLEATFETSAELQSSEASAPVILDFEPIRSPELKQAVAEAEQLIDKSNEILDDVDPADGEELEGLIQKLRSAVADHAETKVNELKTELEDLVFYLQDAT